MAMEVKEKVRLRGEAMKLKAILKIGRTGFSDGVKEELKTLLARHKLVKIRLEEPDRKVRAELAEAITLALQADFIGMTGRTVVLYKES